MCVKSAEMSRSSFRYCTQHPCTVKSLDQRHYTICQTCSTAPLRWSGVEQSSEHRQQLTVWFAGSLCITVTNNGLPMVSLHRPSPPPPQCHVRLSTPFD
jgi:hypothetical protein